MADAPATRPSLLVRLRDQQDRQAWTQFLEVYGPLIYGYARKRGLQDADAADLTQLCLRQVAAHVGSLEYDPQRGTFRGWLFTIVRNKLLDFRDTLRRPDQGSGDSAIQRFLEEQPQPDDEGREWDRDYLRRLLAWAAEQLRPHIQETTWQAFWQTAVDGEPAREVGQRLGLTAAAVYLARSRVMARLREMIREVEEEW
jgi:RNA polymerase sigma-70 factor (ECF subfamily)